ncbi:MAG: substrate-binding domain-containing protein, partial [Oscillospiraceae bacterium]|nr:substrate-binding domain-containing protein [Oscillospiraceae bacterium]
DGLIIHLGSMTDEKFEQVNQTFADRYRNIPKVYIASNRPGLTTINYDNETGIREAVNCLVNINGLTKFCMLGGRDDNVDARARKDIFAKCLAANGITFTDKNYEATNMHDLCSEEAGALLDRNPGVQAIFCVNDASAKGLYQAMAERDLLPGRDVMVFGFDNTHMAGELNPTLSSIGADRCSLGQKAIEVLMQKFNGEEVSSALVPTRLYGRESLQYEMYVYTRMDMLKINTGFIDRMFDDCFYRYKNEFIDRESVNLKRLFFEFMSRILIAMQNRYLSFEEYNEIAAMIDKFFEKGAMEHTDATKLVHSLDKLQSGINSWVKSPTAKIMLNRLFSHMRDRAICAISEQKIHEMTAISKNRQMMQDFIIGGMAYTANAQQDPEQIYRSTEMLRLKNAALYLYESPVHYRFDAQTEFPEQLSLKCVIKSGELYMLPKERQRCKMEDIFRRDELSLKCKGFAAFTIFYGGLIYGFLLCEITDDIYGLGEMIAVQLGKSVYLSDLQRKLDEIHSQEKS